jgi:hypothetical protein
MDADTREIVPLADSEDNSPEEDGDDLVISLDADTPPHGVDPLGAPSPSEEETAAPEVLSVVSSSPAMEVPASAIPDLPLAEEPELPLDVDDSVQAPPASLHRPEPHVIPAAPPTDEPALDLRLHDDEDSAPAATGSPDGAAEHVQTAGDREIGDEGRASRLAIHEEELEPSHARGASPPREEELRLAPADHSGPLAAIDRLRGRLNVLESRTERLERRLLGAGGSVGDGVRAAVGFAIGLVVVLAVLAGLTALVGLTVYAPALDFLKRLLAGVFGG